MFITFPFVGKNSTSELVLSNRFCVLLLSHLGGFSLEFLDPLGVLETSVRYRLWKQGLYRGSLFADSPALRLGSQVQQLVGRLGDDLVGRPVDDGELPHISEPTRPPLRCPDGKDFTDREAPVRRGQE